MMGAECVREWTVGASRAVCVVGSGGRGSCCGIGMAELLVLLLHEIMTPVVLLPLRVHGGRAKGSLERGKGSPVVDLSKLDMQKKCKKNEHRRKLRKNEYRRKMRKMSTAEKPCGI